MATYQQLAGKDVAPLPRALASLQELRTDQELLAWHAQARGERPRLPGTMTVLVPQLYHNHANGNELLVRNGPSSAHRSLWS